MEVYLKDRLVKVLLIYKNNKNIYFRFDDDLNLVITLNKRVKEKEILNLIKKNEDSLYRLLLKSEKRTIHDQEFWYLGNKYQVIYKENQKEIEFQDGTVYTKDDLMLAKFLKSMINNIYRDEVFKLRTIIKTPDFTLKFRKMKTRWGVCNYKNMTITLNTELIKYKKELLRYVIVHEMCHFYYHNHGKDFWNMVSRYYPNYKEARKELRS